MPFGRTLPPLPTGAGIGAAADPSCKDLLSFLPPNPSVAPRFHRSPPLAPHACPPHASLRVGAESIPPSLRPQGQRGGAGSNLWRGSPLFFFFLYVDTEKRAFFPPDAQFSFSLPPPLLCQVLLGTRCTRGPGKNANPIPSCSWRSWRGSSWSMNSLLAKEGGSSQTD